MLRRILTIDGGGMRGVFSAAVIEQMEVKNGKKAHEIFDCFCGTSAGSLIAAGLASGMGATKVKKLFLGLAAESGHLVAADGADKRGAATANLEAALKKVFGDKRASDLLPCYLAIPARDMENGKVVFFGNFPKDRSKKSDFWSNTEVDEDDLLWKIVRRSSALPPMFTPSGQFLDGGISLFANPTYAAYRGVKRRLGWEPPGDKLRFYSVGTGHHTPWVRQLGSTPDEEIYNLMIGAMMQDINFLQHQVMKRSDKAHGDNVWYKRYNINFDSKGFKKFKLGTRTRDEFEKLAQTGSQQVQELADIGTVVGKQLVRAKDFK